MGKRVTCQINQFAGYVVFKDPIPLLTIWKLEETLTATVALFPDKKTTAPRRKIEEIQLPALLECIEEWHLLNVPETITATSFPGSPRREVNELFDWLVAEVMKIYRGNEQGKDPNA